MQDQRNDNVVSLFGKAVAQAQQTPLATSSQAEDQTVEQPFSEVIRRNAENERRLRQDRNKANKSVLRSYRIKT